MFWFSLFWRGLRHGSHHPLKNMYFFYQDGTVHDLYAPVLCLILLCYSVAIERASSIHTTYSYYRGSGSSVSIATGYGLDGPGIESLWGGDFPHLSRPVLGGPPSLLYNGYWVFHGGEEQPWYDVPWSWKGRVIPLLPLWAVWPVQSLSACTRVTFTFTSISAIAVFCIGLDEHIVTSQNQYKCKWPIVCFKVI